MYLEISNIAAALGKNPYESREKMLLTSWARHAPKTVISYFIENNCISKLMNDEETFSKLQEETYKDLLPKEFDNKDFSKIEEKVVNDYKRKRNNKQTESEVEQLRERTKNMLKKDLGNVHEDLLIKKEEYSKGNNRMFYYNITDDFCIGGKHDASSDSDDLLIEIKTRTKKQNVRRNDYDLYQLIGYLLATSFTKGKIIQIYNRQKYDSDVPSEIEYGIIDTANDEVCAIMSEIKENLIVYANDLRNLITTGNYLYLDTVIPKKIRPIAKYYLESELDLEPDLEPDLEIELKSKSKTKTLKICEENIKYKNILRHLT